MGHLTSRRLLAYLAMPLIVAQVGCAARGMPVAPTPPPPSASEEDRAACAKFAKREAKAVKTRPVAEAVGQQFAVGMLAGLYFLNPGVGLVMAPAFAIGGAIDQSTKNSSIRKRAYVSAEDACLKPVVLAETLGPGHPDVASALRSLALGYANQMDYAAAELLYLRALAIQERVLGPETVEVAVTLDAYAELLRATNRGEQATELKARAEAIRAQAEPQPMADVVAATGTTAEAEEPHTVSSPLLPAGVGE